MRAASLRVISGVLACLGASPVLASSAGFAGIAASANSAETASDNPAGMAQLDKSTATISLMQATGLGKVKVYEGQTTTTIKSTDPT